MENYFSPFALPPEFILYADGRLFLTGSPDEASIRYAQLLTKKLERQEVCSLLNTIDQNGFFDYDLIRPGTIAPLFIAARACPLPRVARFTSDNAHYEHSLT